MACCDCQDFPLDWASGRLSWGLGGLAVGWPCLVALGRCAELPDALLLHTVPQLLR